jgi:hypothetical protein
VNVHPFRKRRFPLTGEGGGVWSHFHIRGRDGRAGRAGVASHGGWGGSRPVRRAVSMLREGFTQGFG